MKTPHAPVRLRASAALNPTSRRVVQQATRDRERRNQDDDQQARALESFLHSFPSVTRDQVSRALELSEQFLIQSGASFNEVIA